MKKIIPPIIIFLFAAIDSSNEYSKNIILGLYLLFPLLFIIQACIIDNKKDFFIAILFSSLSTMFIGLLYEMGPTIIAAIIYSILAFCIFNLKNLLKSLIKQ